MAITAWSAKVCNKLDLPVVERPHCPPHQYDDAKLLVPSKQRDAQHSPEAAPALRLVQRIFGIR